MDDIIYLNNAATSWPKAPGVADALYCATLDVPNSPGRSMSNSTEILNECRCLFSKLINISDSNRVVITQHATHSLNLAVLGLNLREGDTVVTSVMEHNSVLRPLNHLVKDKNIKLKIIGLDENNELDLLEYSNALKLKPKAVVLNYVSNVTGVINDINSMLADAKKCGAITVLDASQAAGYIDINPNLKAHEKPLLGLILFQIVHTLVSVYSFFRPSNYILKFIF